MFIYIHIHIHRGFAELHVSFDAVDMEGVRLLPTEQLQVHMDCMNALGQLAAIEDVDDMGGGCWTYIRVSVHGVMLPAEGNGRTAGAGTVAVGDTFLFSPLSTKGRSGTMPMRISGADAKHTRKLLSHGPALPLLGDALCVTHTVPYYRSISGGGVEETSAQRLLSCCKSTHYLAHLGVGSQLDYSGTGLLQLPLLSDHPVMPVVDAEVRVFSEGLLIERIDSTVGLPILISIGAHVKCLWVVDSTEVTAQAFRLLPALLSTFPALLRDHCPEGKLIVLQLKTDEELQKERDEVEEGTGTGEDSGEGTMFKVLQHNLLARSYPFTSGTGSAKEPHLLALFVPARARSSQAMSTALASWKVAARRHDVREHRGADKPLPQTILTAFLTAIDRWAVSGFTGAGGVGSDILQAGGSDLGRGAGVLISGRCRSDTLVSAAQYCVQNPCVQIPVISQLSLRFIHSLSEAQRLALNTSPENLSAITGMMPVNRSTKRHVCIVVGMAGSGGTSLAAQLEVQLSSKLPHSPTTCMLSVSLSDMFERCPSKTVGVMDATYIEEYLSSAVSNVPSPSLASLVIVDLSLSGAHSISSPAALFQLLAEKLSASVSTVVSVVSTASLHIDGLLSKGEGVSSYGVSYCAVPYLVSRYGLGQEQWQALALQLLRPTLCDICVAVDHASASTSYSLLREYLQLVNPSASLLRLTPSSRMRLDGEGIDLIAGQLSASIVPSLSFPTTADKADITIPVSLTARMARQLSEGYDMDAYTEGGGVSLYAGPKIVSMGATAVSGGSVETRGVRRVQVLRIMPSLSDLQKGWNLVRPRHLILSLIEIYYVGTILLLPPLTPLSSSLLPSRPLSSSLPIYRTGPRSQDLTATPSRGGGIQPKVSIGGIGVYRVYRGYRVTLAFHW